MSRYRGHAATFLSLALLLLLGTGLYQRMVNPGLTHHFEHPAEATPSGPTTTTAPTAPAAPLSPSDTEALAKAMAALRADPDNADSLLAVADIFSRNKDWPNAIGFLQRAARAAPGDMRPQYFLGMALAATQDYGGAAAAFERALRVAPESDQSRFNLAVLYRYHLNRANDAARLFRQIAGSASAAAALRHQAEKELQKTAP